MKKQIISLGALAVASSLFTWDNKADAIVTKDYSGKSQVKKRVKIVLQYQIVIIGISLKSRITIYCCIRFIRRLSIW